MLNRYAEIVVNFSEGTGETDIWIGRFKRYYRKTYMNVSLSSLKRLDKIIQTYDMTLLKDYDFGSDTIQYQWSPPIVVDRSAELAGLKTVLISLAMSTFYDALRMAEWGDIFSLDNSYSQIDTWEENIAMAMNKLNAVGIDADAVYNEVYQDILNTEGKPDQWWLDNE